MLRALLRLARGRLTSPWPRPCRRCDALCAVQTPMCNSKREFGGAWPYRVLSTRDRDSRAAMNYYGFTTTESRSDKCDQCVVPRALTVVRLGVRSEKRV